MIVIAFIVGCGSVDETIKEEVIVEQRTVKVIPFDELQKNIKKYYDEHVNVVGYVAYQGQSYWTISGDFYDTEETRWKPGIGAQLANAYKVYKDTDSGKEGKYIVVIQSMQNEPPEEYALPAEHGKKEKYLISGLVRYDEHKKVYFIQVFGSYKK